MQKNLFIFPLIIFFCIILVFSYFLITKRDPSELPSPLINKKAPMFKATSLFDDETILANEIFGEETIIVNFFATWCLPCRAEHSFIEKLSKDKNIKVIGINYKDDSQKTITWLEELGNPYTVIALDMNGNIGLDWGVYGLPETFIVNKNSVITYKQVGPLTKKIYSKFYQKVRESYK
tara:strand:- start:237 stop:770 length:534 start_codon:yes stop_codon:yes gene_type:complete